MTKEYAAMTPLERLVAIEEIKQLKARYFYHYDNKNWAQWHDEVWAPDARIEVPELGADVEPRDKLIEWVREQTADQVSVHHGHMPIIEFTSDTEATGIWAMEDIIWRSQEHPLGGEYAFIHGWGHYRETYVKLEVGWHIRSTRLTRLRTEYLKRL
jgi:hypothetical protein